jgi:ornithine--oxo-acid transaminase
VLCKKWIHEKVFSSMQRSVVHSSTFSQGSLAMVAGLAALDIIDRENLITNAARMGDFIGQGLTAMIPRFEFMKEVRWRGLMTGIEFGPPKSLTLKIAWTTCHTLDKSLFPQAAVIPLLDKHRVITQVAGHNVDVVKLLPPLILTEKDAIYFLNVFEDVMVQMHKFPGPAWDVLTKIGKMAVTQRAR